MVGEFIIIKGDYFEEWVVDSERVQVVLVVKGVKKEYLDMMRAEMVVGNREKEEYYREEVVVNSFEEDYLEGGEQ